MAVVNERAVVSVFNMLERTAIQLPKVLGGLTFDQQIQKLFANNEQGFFYDPNDLSTMFQDAAGTVPVTGAGQPVGLMLDKSKGLVVGNELVVNGNFSSGATGWSVPAPWVVQDGKATAASTSASLTQIGGVSIPNKWYIVEFDVSLTSGILYVTVGANYSGAKTFTTSGRKIVILLAGTATTKSVEFYGGTFTGSIDNVSVKELAGNHAYQTTSASRPILRKNAVTGANYLEFDGSDDFLVTSSIDFTATDKVSLFAGVRKLSDAVTAIVCELSANVNSNVGCFYLAAPPGSNVKKFGLVAKGNTGGNVESDILPAPISATLSTRIDFSGNRTNLRVNGILSENSSNFNEGNFGSHPLYIGRRGGSSLPFTGHIYGLIGVGRLAADNETAAIEKGLAKQTGVTLSV